MLSEVLRYRASNVSQLNNEIEGTVERISRFLSCKCMYMCKLIILLVDKDILGKVDNGHSLINDEQNM